MKDNIEILDPCCGGKMFHFDRENPRVLFGDIREYDGLLCDNRSFKVSPDLLMDFTDLPFKDGAFRLVVFDPPHFHTGGETGWQVIKYGKLNKDNWQEYLTNGFNECWRVLANGGTLIFKWNETQIKIKEVLACFDQEPIVGHRTTHNLKTHWMAFHKSRKPSEQS